MIHKNFRFVIILIFLFAVNSLYSQFIHNFGIKFGLHYSGFITSDASKLFPNGDPTAMNYIGTDFGVYTELFNSTRFCVSTELHYETLGEKETNSFRIIYPVQSTQGEFYKYTYLSRSFTYISFQILPRFRFAVTHDDKVYFLAGPRFDLRIANNNPEYQDAIMLKNMQLETGVTVGIGGEVLDLISFEFRYNYNFSNTFRFIYGGDTITRSFQAYSFIAGVSLKKILKIGSF